MEQAAEESAIDVSLIAGVGIEFRNYYNTLRIFARDGGDWGTTQTRINENNKRSRDSSFTNLTSLVHQLLWRNFGRSQITGPLQLSPEEETSLNHVIDAEEAWLLTRDAKMKKRRKVNAGET